MSKMFGRVYASSNSMAFPWIPSTQSNPPMSMWTVRRAIPSISLFLDLLNVAYYYNTELSTSNQGYRKPDFILKDQILWEHLEKLQKIKIGLFHDKNPSPRYAEPHIPGKGIFYALALVKYRCCILKIPGLGPAPARQRILYTQISRTRASSCSAAYTCILKFPEPRLAPARQRILYTQNARVRAGFYSIAYTCILKMPGSGLVSTL